jgi:hypothetical protein
VVRSFAGSQVRKFARRRKRSNGKRQRGDEKALAEVRRRHPHRDCLASLSMTRRAGASPAPSMRRPGVKGGGCGWGEGSGGFGCGSCWSVAAGCVLRGPGVGAPDDLLSVAGCAGKPNPACAIKAPVHTQGRTVPSTVTVVRRPGAGTDSSKPARPTDHAFLIRLPSRSLPRPRYAALSRAPCGTQSNSR